MYSHLLTKSPIISKPIWDIILLQDNQKLWFYNFTKGGTAHRYYGPKKRTNAHMVYSFPSNLHFRYWDLFSNNHYTVAIRIGLADLCNEPSLSLK